MNSELSQATNDELLSLATIHYSPFTIHGITYMESYPSHHDWQSTSFPHQPSLYIAMTFGAAGIGV